MKPLYPENKLFTTDTGEEIHNFVGPNVLIGDDCHLGENYSLGCMTAIEDGVNCGGHLFTEGDCLIGKDATLGIGVRIYTNSVIGEGSILGNHVDVHMGSRIPTGTIVLDYGNVTPDSTFTNGIRVDYPEKRSAQTDSSEFVI